MHKVKLSCASPTAAGTAVATPMCEQRERGMENDRKHGQDWV